MDEGITSWKRALAESKLQPEQLTLLEEMVRSGKAASLEAAADILDWQDNVIHRDEHMWGF